MYGKRIYIEDIMEKFKNDTIIRYREIKSDDETIHVVYDSDLCDTKFLSEYIITPLINNEKKLKNVKMIKEQVITSVSIGDVTSTSDAINHIASGDVVVIFSSNRSAIYCEAKGYAQRAITTPPTETVIKGPREGFTEDINTNISCIKRRIKSPDLKFEKIVLGQQSKTTVYIAYMEGITPLKLLNYIRTKVNSINQNFLLYSNQIEEQLKCKGTPFDTIGYTEKPDKVAMKLAEGRVAILVDGSPFTIIAPHFFIENFHATDDYTMNKFIANTGTILRWISFLSSTLLPGVFVALFTYHFNLIPYIFVFRMAASRAGVPFPMAVEVLIMMFFFQVLREAGVRLPQPIGPTLSIVGALILGDAAVNSGLTSQVTVLIVALTSIASFLVPPISNAIFVWNIIILIFSSLLGLPGFYMGFVIFVAHLASLTTCGYPYLYPIGTLRTFKYSDIIFRGDLDKINNSIFIKDDEQ